MSAIVLLFILGLVVAQLVRLWRDDDITEGLRSRVLGWLDDRTSDTRRGAVAGWVSDLLECPWCLSGWLSIIVVIGVDVLTETPVPVPAIFWLAVWRLAVLAYWLVEVLADADGEIVKPSTRNLSVKMKP